MSRDRGQGGYALLAAVAALAAFGSIALEVLSAERGAVAGVAAHSRRARLDAAAQAGTAIAIHGLGLEDRASRWTLDGRPHRAELDGMALTMVVEDERGKIPINRLDEDQVRRLFAQAGVDGERLDTLTDSFGDWLDDDQVRRPHGAEAPDYVAEGVEPSGIFETVEDLAYLKGMDARLMDRLRPYLTVNFGQAGGFSPATASPFALGVMSQGGQDSPEAIQRARELAGQRTALDIADAAPLIGRPLTVRVTAQDRSGARVSRSVIVELTGARANPYFIRESR